MHNVNEGIKDMFLTESQAILILIVAHSGNIKILLVRQNVFRILNVKICFIETI